MIGSVTGAIMLPMTAHVQRSLEQRERVVAHELERSVRDEMTMLRDVDTTHREPSQLDVLLNERAQLLETLRAASVVMVGGLVNPPAWRCCSTSATSW